MPLARHAGRSRSPTLTDSQVGQNIRLIRRSRHLSLSELAATVGLSHQQLQKYETGVNRISAGMLHELSAVLAVPMEEFFAGLEGGAEDDVLMRARGRCLKVISAETSADQLRIMASVLQALLSAPATSGNTPRPAGRGKSGLRISD